MLDTLGVMIAGGAHGDIQNLATIWPTAGGQCGVVTGARANAEGGALINGSAAHFWDFDDTSYTGIMHGSAVILPVVLALAQETGASEEEARTAFIIGSEITYTLADICAPQHYFHGWWSTVTLGLIGATAAAARLIGCSQTQIAEAIGLAASASGGGKSVFGTNAKPFLVGDCAQRAIRFARFIAAGLSGPTKAMAGQGGFLHLLSNDAYDLTQAETLGQRWRLVDPGLLVKLNPVCSAAHAAIEEIARLTYHTGLSPDEIERIQIEVPHLVRISLIHDHPVTSAQAQFSLPFAAACAVLNGKVRLRDLNSEMVNAATTQALMAKVKITEAPDLSTQDARRRHPESARIAIALKAGGKRSGFCGQAYGMPAAPLSDIHFLQKFHDCLAFAGCTAHSSDLLSAEFLPVAEDLFGQITCARQSNTPTTQNGDSIRAN
jgi:2-methylcitrate dehydratase PrpD